MKNFNNNNIIKYLLIYWLLLVFVQVFFHPFTSARINGKFIERWIEWGTLFNFVIFIPLVVVAIIKIIQFKK